jgi:para-nitrobenzyl esterase
VFDNVGTDGAIFGAADSPANRAIRDEVGAAWGGFVATGDPGWPTYRPARRTTPGCSAGPPR